MKTTLLLIFLLCFFANSSIAQTKLIAHKSHSGSVDNFKKSLQFDLFDIGNSNFGVAPRRVVKNASLDSLIFLSENRAIMVTANHCNDTYTHKESTWTPGRDTVYNHPLFSKQHSLDSIKMILDRNYNFENTSNGVVFIGYDNGEHNGQQQGQHRK